MVPRRARQNPQGLPVQSADQRLLVMVGKRSTLTHLYDPAIGMHACQSGKNAGRQGLGAFEGAKYGQGQWLRDPPELYATQSKHITCYRCAKLAEINLENSGGRSVAPTGRKT